MFLNPHSDISFPALHNPWPWHFAENPPWTKSCLLLSLEVHPSLFPGGCVMGIESDRFHPKMFIPGFHSTERSKSREKPQGCSTRKEIKCGIRGSLIFFALCWEFPCKATEQPARNAGFGDFWIYSLPCFVSKERETTCWMLQLAQTVQAKDTAAKPGTPKQPPSPNPGWDCLPDWNFKEDTHTDSLYP